MKNDSLASEISKTSAHKSNASDGIRAKMLEQACPTIVPVITKLTLPNALKTHSLQTAEIVWRRATVG